jgi:membrane carboxypeptidase/penicillin-binding protein PbpC
MLPALVPIAAKKPVGRQSNNNSINKSINSSLPSINNNSTLIVLATIASQVYNIKLDPTNRKSTKDIITSLKTQYTIDRNLQKRIEEVVDDIDSNLPDYKKIRDNHSNIDGTLHVCRYVHRKLKLTLIYILRHLVVF